MQKDQNKSKKGLFSQKLSLMIVTFVIGMFIFPAWTTFAAEPTIDEVPTDCRVINEKGDDNSTMPSSFPVGRCLSTQAQRESKFLPTIAEGQAATSSTESLMSAQSVIIDVVDIFVKIIATLSLIVFIFGAFITIISNGSDDLLGRGKSAMIYSVVGLAVAMLSFIIVTAVQSLFFNS